MTKLRWLGWTTFLFMALPAQAMRIGDLQTQSLLNQPLAAVLPVQSLSAEERSSLNVKVAGVDAYQRLGIERSVAVEGLRFDLLPNAAGGVDVQIRGRRPVVEPYVVLVLDFQTNSGRMLREFTVLLNPASAVQPDIWPSEAPIADAQNGEPANAQRMDAEDAVEDKSSSPVARMADQANRQSVGEPTSRQSLSVDGNKPIISDKDYAYTAPMMSGSSGVRYGPIKAGESLSSIANELQAQTGGQVSQLIWALYDANPAAFDGSIDRLQVGATLDVPSTAAIRKVSVSQARANIRDAAIQGSDGSGAGLRDRDEVERATVEGLRAEIDRAEAEAADSQSAPASTRSENAPTVSDAVEVESPVVVMSDADDGFATIAEPPVEAIPDLADSTDANNAARAIEAGSDSGDSGDPVPVVPTVVQSEPKATLDLVAVIELLRANAIPALAILGLILLLLIVASRRKRKAQREEVTAEAITATAAAPARPMPDLVSMARGEPIPDPTEISLTESDAPKEPETEDSIVVLDDAPLGVTEHVAGANSLLATEGVDGDSVVSIDVAALDGDVAAGVKAGTDEETEESATLDAGDAAALTELAKSAEPEDADALPLDDAPIGVFDLEGEPDESEGTVAEEPKSGADEGDGESLVELKDVVAEAEFQLAYGLYDEAIDTLSALLETEPGRLDAKEKLGEVYFAAGRAGDFEKLALSMREEVPDSAEYKNIEGLARQLIPESRMFATNNDQEVAADDSRDTENVVEFDLTEIESTPQSESTDDAASVEEHAGNLIDFSLDDGEESQEEAVEAVPSFALNEDEAHDSTPKPLEELSLEEFGLTEEAESESAEPKAEPEGFVIDEAEVEDLSLDSFDDGLADDGEMAGKLDLARGYADMGEKAVAKSLLDEVISRGSESEQAEARKMLESLN